MSGLLRMKLPQNEVVFNIGPGARHTNRSFSVPFSQPDCCTVTRLGLPPQLRGSLAWTNMIESMSSVIRQVCPNVKRWPNASMAGRWTGAAMLEARKGLRRLKAHQQPPILKEALEIYHARTTIRPAIDRLATTAQ